MINEALSSSPKCGRGCFACFPLLCLPGAELSAALSGEVSLIGIDGSCCRQRQPGLSRGLLGCPQRERNDRKSPEHGGGGAAVLVAPPRAV